MPKTIIVANWKMNPLRKKDAKDLFTKIKRKGNNLRTIETIICSPYIYLESLAPGQTSRITVGAQDTFFEKEGAYTGFISPAMLADLGVRSAIVGHSERRLMGDTNEIVAKKVRALLDYRIRPILCVGEIVRDERGEYLDFLKEEIESAFNRLPEAMLKLFIIAYEPVWAIGKNAQGASTPADFLEKAIFIRKIISDLYSQKVASSIPILYGGSVDERNARSFLRDGKAQGLLVGRASLNLKSFATILAEANTL